MEEIGVKEKILKSSEALLTRYGTRSISMDDIARHVGVSKKTLYQHFADKEDLVTEVCFVALKCDQEEYEKIEATAENAIDELVKISLVMKKHMAETNPTLIFDLQKFHPRAWSVWTDFKEKYIRQSVVRNLKQGKREGFFREDINPEMLAILRLQVMEMAFNPELFPKDQFYLSQIQAMLFDHFIYGIVTDKGRKLYDKLKKQFQI
ncbi:MAG: TetR/AcrR family transcriptional regulator [Cyclobacteriaceae bacterium]|jgi:AcrR family transcriptional regulator|nr:TetR/AcrR family transcriptional regulator [Cyclobacteriaceae bacterium]